MNRTTIIWIIVSVIILALLLVLLLVPMFSVDLDMAKCSNKTVDQINAEFQANGIDNHLDPLPLGECISNLQCVQTGVIIYAKKHNLTIDAGPDAILNQTSSGDRIKIGNLGVGTKFVTVSFNIHKLINAMISTGNDSAETRVIKLKKNLLGTIYRY